MQFAVARPGNDWSAETRYADGQRPGAGYEGAVGGIAA